jgi:hypothetical protein
MAAFMVMGMCLDLFSLDILTRPREWKGNIQRNEWRERGEKEREPARIWETREDKECESEAVRVQERVEWSLLLIPPHSKAPATKKERQESREDPETG